MSRGNGSLFVASSSQKLLAICGFVLDLVRNLKDRFSPDVAHILYSNCYITISIAQIALPTFKYF